MSSRYDSRTTMFSPEGRLYQVEYAVEAIAQAGSALGIVTSEGIVFASERRVSNPLLDTEHSQLKDQSGDKVVKIDDHIAFAVAGITSDANLLVERARLWALSHRFTFQEPMPAEKLVQYLCDLKQMYTQSGGQRPFGVSFLVAAWDRQNGLQLYQTDPSGNYNAWRAYAIGQNDGAAQNQLKSEWKEGMSLHEGLLLALKVLSKTMDSANLTPEKLEFAVLRKDKGAATKFHILTSDDMKPLLAEAQKIREAEEDKE